MGQIIQAKFSEIIPGEDGFDPCKIKTIIDYVNNGGKPLPVPARKLKEPIEGYLHLDGRHRLLYKKMSRVKTAELFLAESRQDYLSMRDYPNANEWFLIDNNDNLSRRWHFATDSSYLLRSISGVTHFDDFFDKIVENFPFMKSIRSFEKQWENDPSLAEKWCESIVDTRLTELV